MERIRRAAEEDKAEIKRRHEVEQKRLQEAASQGKQALKEMEAILKAERDQREQDAKAKDMLQKKLRAMEEKLISGGELMDKAAKQEYALRQAQIELEERRLQEAELARELAEREE